MMNTTRFAILTAMLFAGAAMCAANAAGDDGGEKFIVILRSGKVLPDAYVLDKKPNGITIAYKEGCMFIPYSDMPLEYQQKFGYDPIKSARYEKQIDELKSAIEKEEDEQRAREKKYKAEADKHYKDSRISIQQRKVRELELQLEDAKKRLDTTEKTISQDRNVLGISAVNSEQVCIESPWGYGVRIHSNSAVTNKFMTEADTMSAKSDNPAQDVIDLQLKLEAAQKTLDALMQNGK